MAVAWLFPARSGLMGFCFSVWSPSSSACGGTPVGWFYVAACCLSFDVLGGSLVRFRGWFCGHGVCFLFAVLRCCPPLLRDACPSQSVVGSALVEVFGFLLPEGAVRPVSSSPGFFAAVWSSPRHQLCGVRFSSSSWNLLLGQSVNDWPTSYL